MPTAAAFAYAASSLSNDSQPHASTAPSRRRRITGRRRPGRPVPASPRRTAGA